MKKLSKKQVAEILGVHTKSLSRWDNEKITNKLAKQCYKVNDIVKEGRSIYFYVEYEEYSQSNDEHLKEVFKVKDIDNFKCYTKRKIKSIEDEDLAPRKQICKETNTTKSTSHRYDEKLLEKGVFEKLDDVLYICANKKTGERTLVDKEAYNEFWYKNHLLEKELRSLRIRYTNKEISLKDYEYLREMLISSDKCEYMYYKVSKIVVKYDNYLCQMLMDQMNKSGSFFMVEDLI